MNDKYKNKLIDKKFYSKFKINNSPITDEEKKEKGYIYVPYILCEHTEESLKNYKEFKKNYNNQHKYCPKCGSEIYNTTLIDYIVNWDKKNEYKDMNICKCIKCGNKHYTHDRISYKK